MVYASCHIPLHRTRSSPIACEPSSCLTAAGSFASHWRRWDDFLSLKSMLCSYFQQMLQYYKKTLKSDFMLKYGTLKSTNMFTFLQMVCSKWALLLTPFDRKTHRRSRALRPAPGRRGWWRLGRISEIACFGLRQLFRRFLGRMSFKFLPYTSIYHGHECWCIKSLSNYVTWTDA